MRLVLSLTMVAIALPLQAEWTPPADPDPSTILNEAHGDTLAGRYDDALAKHLWYHENALVIEPAQYGVRLSFALAYWKELADKHAPALEAMQKLQAAARARVNERGSEDARAFHEFASFNEYLGGEDATLDVYLDLERDSREFGKRCYRSVETLLIDAGEWEVCGRYVGKPEERLKRAVETRQMQLDMASRGDFAELKTQLVGLADRRLSIETSRVIAVLVHNDRASDAEEIADEARELLSKKKDLARIEVALNGEPPKEP